MKSNSKGAFFALLRAGLWADVESTDLRNYGSMDSVDWEEVYQLAEEQSVIGVILAGIEYSNVKPPQELLLQWIGEVQMIEQQNNAMNDYVAQLNKLLWQNKIYSLLVKGQGVAQCYEKPLWRTSGDVDLLLDDDNYEKAKAMLIPLADEVQIEDVRKRHQAIIIKSFDVELHGKMPFGLSRKVDKVINAVIEDSLKLGGTRVWTLYNSDIYLPNADNDVILVFTHFLRHFFIEGVGLRQICDWCRLLYTYKDVINKSILCQRLLKAGLMSEWQVFGALVVGYLGMPIESMPFYKDSKGMRRKAKRVLERVIINGNFGHNNDLSYRTEYSGIVYKVVALWRRLIDFMKMSPIFPVDGPRFFVRYAIGKLG